MNALTSTLTADKLASMLTENTGRSMLDSGDAYGRAWERNQGLTTSDFINRPSVVVDEYGDVSLDLFHYLNDRLTYASGLDADWCEYDAQHPELTWGESLDEWLDGLGVPAESDSADFYSDARMTINTYNFDSLLGGVFQFVKFVFGDKEYVALQVHGGCDVRGGYTKPVIFSGCFESLICDLNNYSLTCPADDCGFVAHYSDGSLVDYELPDSPATPEMLIEIVAKTELPAGWQYTDGCPIHKTTLG